MTDEIDHSVPATQREILGRCFHPTGTWREFPAVETARSIVDRFEGQVRLHRGRTAVSHDGHQLTYDQLNRTANRVAHALLAQAGETAEPVALVFEHGAAMLAALLGVLKAGKFYVPLNLHDPPARLAHILEDSMARLIVADGANLALARQVAGARQVLNFDVMTSQGSDECPGLSLPFDAYAYLIYTSGSTGEPKGVIETHCDVLHFTRVLTNAYHVSPDDRFTLVSTLSFSAAASPTYAALLNGARVCVFDLGQQGVEALACWLRQEAVTICDSVPAIWRRLAGILQEGDRFPRLRLVALGGDRLYREDVDRLRRFLASHCLIRNGLGTSEVKQIAHFFMDRDGRVDTSMVPVGYPVSDTQVLIVNEDGQEVAAGEVGEIWVKGRYMSPGYWRRPDLTVKAFAPDSESPDERIYRTGDLGSWLPDGALLHIGRADSQVKIRGYRVELSEVESALRSTGGVQEAVVIARSTGSSDPWLHAYVTLDPGVRLTGAAVRSQVLRLLPAYMAPAKITILDALPLNVNGKVDRRALQERDLDHPTMGDETPPRTMLEERLRDLWQGVLGIEGIGIFDDFFALGGASLQAMALVNRLQPLFGDGVTVAALFDAPTIAELAAYLTLNFSSQDSV